MVERRAFMFFDILESAVGRENRPAPNEANRAAPNEASLRHP
jgi:hypothetical protein